MNELRDKLVRIYLLGGSDRVGILLDIATVTREIQLKTVKEGIIFIPNASILYAREEKGERGISEDKKREYARLENL